MQTKKPSIKLKAILLSIIVILSSFIHILFLTLGFVEIIDFRCDAEIVGYKRYETDVNEEINFIYDVDNYENTSVFLGDGTYIDYIIGSTFSHSYNTEGIYNVTFWAMGAGPPDSEWLIIEVTNDAPDFDIGYTSIEYHNGTFDFEDNGVGLPPQGWNEYNNDIDFYLGENTIITAGTVVGGNVSNLFLEDFVYWNITSIHTGQEYRYIDIILKFEQWENHILTPETYKFYFSANDSMSLLMFNPELEVNEILFDGSYAYGQVITLNYPQILELYASFYIEGSVNDTESIMIDFLKFERVEKGVEVVKDEHDHGKIVKMNFGGPEQYCGMRQTFPMQEYGTIELWYKTENTNIGGDIFSISDEFGLSQKENTWYVSGNDITDPFYGFAPLPQNKTWYHVRIDWAGPFISNYMGLGYGYFKVYINGESSKEFGMNPSWIGINSLNFESNGTVYIDAVGYSWDPLYDVGNNFVIINPDHLYEDLELRFSVINLEESEIDKVGFSYNLETDVCANYSYLWDFGDGNYSREESPTYKFTNAGEYPVRLTLVDDQGAMKTRLRTFIIENKRPTSSIIHGLNYDVSYDFKFDISGQSPTGLYTHGNIEVIDFKDEFSKVLEIDNEAGGYGMIRFPESEINYNGSVEFWMYFTSHENDQFFFWVDKLNDVYNNPLALRNSTRFGFFNGKWMLYYTFKGSSNEDRYAYAEILELDQPQIDKWTHIRFDYCFSENTNYEGLTGNQWRVYIDGQPSNIYDAVGKEFNRLGIDFKAGSHMFMDSFGFTSDPSYQLGDNNPTRLETYYGTWDFRFYPNGPIPYDETIQSTVLGPWMFASYNFEKISDSCSANIISELDGHHKVLELYDNDNEDLVFASLLDLAEANHGTLEFWLRTTDTSQGLVMSLGHHVFYSGIWLGSDGDWWYKNGDEYIPISDLPSMSNDTWHHIRVDFECRENGNYYGLSKNQFNIRIDGVQSQHGPFNFDVPVSDFSWNIWSTKEQGVDYSIFLDAIGASWDPTYDVGDNLHPRMSVYADTEIIFSGDCTDTPTDKDNLRYLWMFGDNQTGFGQTVLHRYGRAGKYKVKLITIDDNGIFDTYEQYIWIDNYYPDIHINYLRYGSTTFDFDDDKIGEFPEGWYRSYLEEITANITKVVEGIDEFQNIVLIGNSTGIGGIWTCNVNNLPYNQSDPGDLNLLNGTIEFWLYTTDTSISEIYISFFEDNSQDGIFIEFVNGSWSHGAHELIFENNWELQDNSWAHFRIDFCCDNSLYNDLENDTFIIYADDNPSQILEMNHNIHPDISNLTCFGIFTDIISDQPIQVYVDNFGFSWDPYYIIGENKFPYTQHEFNEGETIILEAIGYDTFTDYQQLIYQWGDSYMNIGEWEDQGWYYSLTFLNNIYGDEDGVYPIIGFVGDPLYIWDIDSYNLTVENVLPTLDIHSAYIITNISGSIYSNDIEGANFSVSIVSDNDNQTIYLANYPSNYQGNLIELNSSIISLDASEEWNILVNQTAREGGQHTLNLTLLFENGYQVELDKNFDGIDTLWTIDLNEIWIDSNNLSSVPLTFGCTISDPSDDKILLTIDYIIQMNYEVDYSTPIYNKSFIIGGTNEDITCYLEILERNSKKFVELKFIQTIPNDWYLDLISGTFPVSYDFFFNGDMTDLDIHNTAIDILNNENINTIDFDGSNHFINAEYYETQLPNNIQYETFGFNITSKFQFDNLSPKIIIYAPDSIMEDQSLAYSAETYDINGDYTETNISFGINYGEGLEYQPMLNSGNEPLKANFTYTNAGMYLIQVIADDGVNIAKKLHLIEVINRAPYAKVRSFQNVTHEDEVIIFKADFYDTDSDIKFLRHYWDFGDGVYSADKSPSHAYMEAGIYTVKLHVKDNNGDSFCATYIIEVVENPPNIIGPFSFSGIEGQTITLNVDVIDSIADYNMAYTWEIYRRLNSYNSTYNFDEIETDDLPGFPFEFYNDPNVNNRIVEEIAGHYKVLEIEDNNNQGEGHFLLKYGDTGSINGSIEFWLRSTFINPEIENLQISISKYGTEIIPIFISANGTWIYRNYYLGNSSEISNLPRFFSNTWHHVRIDYECSNGNYSGLKIHEWRIIVDGISSQSFMMQFGLPPNDTTSYLDCLHIKSGTLAELSIYCDAIGYYNGMGLYSLGDNLYPVPIAHEYLDTIYGRKPSLALDEGSYIVELEIENEQSAFAQLTIDLINLEPVITVTNKKYYGSSGYIEIHAYAWDSFIDSENLEFEWLIANRRILVESGTLSSKISLFCDESSTIKGFVSVRDTSDLIASQEFSVDIVMDSNGDGFTDEWELLNNLTTTDIDNDGLPNFYEILTTNTSNTDPDTDGDGLSDGWNIGTFSGEFSIGTNPLINDTDSDNLLDGFEFFGWNHTIYTGQGKQIVKYTSSPLMKDTDNDLLDDYEEYIYKTNPRRADTDNDGLTDFLEIYKYGSDPTNPDCDNDRLLDGMEFKIGTLYNNSDTDGDTIKDGDEYFGWAFITNPLLKDSDNDYLADNEETVNFNYEIDGRKEVSAPVILNFAKRNVEKAASAGINFLLTYGEEVSNDLLSDIKIQIFKLDSELILYEDTIETDNTERYFSRTIDIKDIIENSGQTYFGYYILKVTYLDDNHGELSLERYSINVIRYLDPNDNDFDNDGIMDGVESRLYAQGYETTMFDDLVNITADTDTNTYDYYQFEISDIGKITDADVYFSIYSNETLNGDGWVNVRVIQKEIDIRIPNIIIYSSNNSFSALGSYSFDYHIIPSSYYPYRFDGLYDVILEIYDTSNLDLFILTNFSLVTYGYREATMEDRDAWITNPGERDSDYDGWSDGYEIYTRSEPTNPISWDTDGDGIRDSRDLDPLRNVLLKVKLKKGHMDDLPLWYIASEQHPEMQLVVTYFFRNSNISYVTPVEAATQDSDEGAHTAFIKYWRTAEFDYSYYFDIEDDDRFCNLEFQLWDKGIGVWDTLRMEVDYIHSFSEHPPGSTYDSGKVYPTYSRYSSNDWLRFEISTFGISRSNAIAIFDNTTIFNGHYNEDDSMHVFSLTVTDTPAPTSPFVEGLNTILIPNEFYVNTILNSIIQNETKFDTSILADGTFIAQNRDEIPGTSSNMLNTLFLLECTAAEAEAFLNLTVVGLLNSTTNATGYINKFASTKLDNFMIEMMNIHTDVLQVIPCIAPSSLNDEIGEPPTDFYEFQRELGDLLVEAIQGILVGDFEPLGRFIAKILTVVMVLFEAALVWAAGPFAPFIILIFKFFSLINHYILIGILIDLMIRVLTSLAMVYGIISLFNDIEVNFQGNKLTVNPGFTLSFDVYIEYDAFFNMDMPTLKILYNGDDWGFFFILKADELTFEFTETGDETWVDTLEEYLEGFKKMGKTMQTGGKTHAILGPSITAAKATYGLSLIAGVIVIIGFIISLVYNIDDEVEEKGNAINLGIGLGFLISGVAAIVPNTVKEFGFSRYKTAYIEDDLKKQAKNLNKLFKNVGYAIDFLSYSDHLNIDNIAALAIDAVGGIIKGTNSLITGSIVLSAFKDSWSRVARVILGVIYLVLGIYFLVQFVDGLVE
ncbi:MAG: PKD domain-containing protein [Candidatus Lokiarchaeota archaeon]|nr:PKD domain-containing protein [Candidatus Lokiarchaeota archaeon]